MSIELEPAQQHVIEGWSQKPDTFRYKIIREALKWLPESQSTFTERARAIGSTNPEGYIAHLMKNSGNGAGRIIVKNGDNLEFHEGVREVIAELWREEKARG
jgi:hypothetical protein